MLARDLFSDALESSWHQRTHRGWTTLTSFAVQALATGSLLLLPLLRPAGLPTFHQISTPIRLGQPLAEAPALRARAGSSYVRAHPSSFYFRRPSPIPGGTHPVADDPPPDVGNGPYLPGAQSGYSGGVANMFTEGARPLLPAPVPAAIRPLHLSHMSEGSLTHKVQPVYPPLARSARIQGTVVLQAVISRQGTIENLAVASGHPMLVKAAVDAVRQWRYRPYILNHEPVEVETQITVNFSLAGPAQE